MKENSLSRKKTLDSVEASRQQALEITTLKETVAGLQHELDLNTQKGNNKDKEVILLREKVKSREKNIALADLQVDSLKKEVIALNNI